jgi:hypothetical protein
VRVVADFRKSTRKRQVDGETEYDLPEREGE